MLVKNYPSLFEICQVFTTCQGTSYRNTTKAEFQQKVSNNELIEYSMNFQEFYGISRADMEKPKESNRIAILITDTNGALQVYSQYVDANFLFVYPPSLEMLRERLNSKHSENEEIVKARMSKGIVDMEKSNNTFLFKNKLVNEKVDTAFKELTDICKSLYKEEWK